jgi:NAD(P)-dependent dehydrogenase (short-subunit alcohol dehydrogenase family)/acyl carrier protein
MGRRGASADAEKILEEMRRQGSRVEVARADVADEERVSSVLAEVAASMPPLRGVIHAAGVLDDGILLQQNLDRFRTTMAPKILGAWNLHRLTDDTPLDFFVMFSSASSVFGSSGQGNYAAANAFLDALAHHRHATGRPAVAINWGAWGQIGLASRPDRIEWLKRQGVIPFSTEQGLAALERLLAPGPAQVMANSVDWDRFVEFLPTERESRLLVKLCEERVGAAAEEPVRGQGKTPEQEGIREELLHADPHDRRDLLESYLGEQVAKVLGHTTSKPARQKSLLTLGLDSLMATEIRNRIEASLGVVLPVTTFLQGCSISDLAGELLDQLPAELPRKEDDLERALEQVEKLSPEQARMLLSKKKAELAQRRNPR